MTDKEKDYKLTGMRLNKYLSDSGFCSRREADRLISSGKVIVDGNVAVLGQKVFENDKVMVNGRLVCGSSKKIIIMLNKPPGIECTTARVYGNIVDYIGIRERIYPVGRLDKYSRGLILLTNDGELSNLIMRSRYAHEREYEVRVNHPITDDFLKKMRQGVKISDITTRPCKVHKTSVDSFSIILTQGLNRQIRRMCEELGYRVADLKRVRIMHLTLGKLGEGKWRYLSDKECEILDGKLRNT